MPKLTRLSVLGLVIAISMFAVREARADEPDVPSWSGIYPITLVSDMSLGPNGMELRLGGAFERDPARPRTGASWRGFGLGYGGGIGYAIIGAQGDGANVKVPPRTGA